MRKIVCIAFVLFVMNSKAQIITTVAGDGSGYNTGDGGQATVASLGPNGVVFDSVCNLYISSSSVIRKVNTQGIISTYAGNNTAGYSGDGGQATAAALNQPNGVAFDAAGNLYIADLSNEVIRKVNAAGIISTFAGNGMYGFSGDGGQATNAELYNPRGVAVDAAGNLYIADGKNNRVRMVNTAGIITTIAGGGTSGLGDGGQATAAELNLPSGVALDVFGNMYIVDGGHMCIRKINNSGIISTFVGFNNPVGGYSGDGGQSTAAQLCAPFAVVADNAGNLYISDWGNQVIRMASTAGIITTIAGTGFGATIGNCGGTQPPSSGGYTGDGGAATSANLSYPMGVTLDAAGNLFIADSYNARVRMVTNVAAASTNNCGVFSAIHQVTGINEQVSIYPNPASTSINLTISQFDNAQTNSVEIYNTIGECVHRQMITSPSPPSKGETYTIDVSDLAEGVYQFIIHNSEFTINKKVVIVR